MDKVVGICFRKGGKIYQFNPGHFVLKEGDEVIVKTDEGLGFGLVATPIQQLGPDYRSKALKEVFRLATDSDRRQYQENLAREKEARQFCQERIENLALPMKLVSVECFFDASKYIFYFTADGRVDFRELVKQLVARFPARIEMRQIGVRHEAKMTGGLACCGQELCCSRFLSEFRPVSVKMAKNQNLSLNPSKTTAPT